jgi:hypothetical protein
VNVCLLGQGPTYSNKERCVREESVPDFEIGAQAVHQLLWKITFCFESGHAYDVSLFQRFIYTI